MIFEISSQNCNNHSKSVEARIGNKITTKSSEVWYLRGIPSENTIIKQKYLHSNSLPWCIVYVSCSHINKCLKTIWYFYFSVWFYICDTILDSVMVIWLKYERWLDLAIFIYIYNVCDVYIYIILYEYFKLAWRLSSTPNCSIVQSSWQKSSWLSCLW